MSEPKKLPKWYVDGLMNFDIPNSGMTSDEYDERMKDDLGGWSRQYPEPDPVDLDKLLEELTERLRKRTGGDPDIPF